MCNTKPTTLVTFKYICFIDYLGSEAIWQPSVSNNIKSMSFYIPLLPRACPLAFSKAVPPLRVGLVFMDASFSLLLCVPVNFISKLLLRV